MPSNPCKKAADVGRVSSLIVYALASTSLTLVNCGQPKIVPDGIKELHCVVHGPLGKLDSLLQRSLKLA